LPFLDEPLEVIMGPATSGSLGSFPPPSRHAAPTGLDETEIFDVEEAALASLPRRINWYAIACRVLGVLVIGCAVGVVWKMAQYPQARGAMIEWVTFGKAH
jgi:hypothetical protein